MPKPLRTILSMLALAAACVPVAPAAAQQTARPQESPWAMRAPAAAPQGAPTRSAGIQGTPEQQELARKIVYAMYAKDFAAIKQLISPATMKCIGQNQNYLDDEIRRQFELPISKDYHLTVTKLPPDLIKDTKWDTYPTPATHLLGIEFVTPEGNTVTVNEKIGEENGHWYEVEKCPTELGMQRFAKQQQIRAQARERAKAAVARINEPLKSQLLALIAKRDNADARMLCMKSLKVDVGTAQGIVEVLENKEAE